MTALILLVLALTPASAREQAFDAAPVLTEVNGKVSVGRCVVKGRYGRCPARVRASWRSCRVVVHIAPRKTYGTGLECWDAERD